MSQGMLKATEEHPDGGSTGRGLGGSHVQERLSLRREGVSPSQYVGAFAT